MADDLPDRALSIRQPWAWAILHAGKDIENRDWHTFFRGPICIHASKGCTRAEYEDAAAFIQRTSGLQVPGLASLPRGGIVGVMTITGCTLTSDSPWFFGEYGFDLAQVRPIELIPAKGSLGFFRWRDAQREPNGKAKADELGASQHETVR